ncbi:MAG TPA: ATP synthase subunit I, partial [Acidimicrobiales bacterium]
MFDRFSLPDVMTVSRRTMLMTLVIGVVGLVVLLLVSQPWAALGLCVGLGLGMLNFRAIQRSVVKVGERVEANKRRPLAINTLGRMAIITVVALGLL